MKSQNCHAREQVQGTLHHPPAQPTQQNRASNACTSARSVIIHPPNHPPHPRQQCGITCAPTPSSLRPALLSCSMCVTIAHANPFQAIRNKPFRNLARTTAGRSAGFTLPRQNALYCPNRIDAVYGVSAASWCWKCEKTPYLDQIARFLGFAAARLALRAAGKKTPILTK